MISGFFYDLFFDKRQKIQRAKVLIMLDLVNGHVITDFNFK